MSKTEMRKNKTACEIRILPDGKSWLARCTLHHYECSFVRSHEYKPCSYLVGGGVCSCDEARAVAIQQAVDMIAVLYEG